MNEQVVEIFVDDEGNVTFHAKGLGTMCEALIDELDAVLTGKKSTQLTDEYFGGDEADGAQRIAW